jgi:hypothetical protein
MLRQSSGEPADDIVLHSARRQTDRVRDRLPARVAVRDDREAAEAEEIGAAVGVRIEPCPEAPGGRPDQQTAEPAASRRGDFLTERVEELADGNTVIKPKPREESRRTTGWRVEYD